MTSYVSSIVLLMCTTTFVKSVGHIHISYTDSFEYQASYMTLTRSGSNLKVTLPIQDILNQTRPESGCFVSTNGVTTRKIVKKR